MSADSCWIDDCKTATSDLGAAGGVGGRVVGGGGTDRPLRLADTTAGSIKANCIRAHGLSSTALPPVSTDVEHEVFARLTWLNLPVAGEEEEESAHGGAVAAHRQ